MNTPICDFVREYAESNTIRAHMPGHKGQLAVVDNSSFFVKWNRYDFAMARIFSYDITEIAGADELYHAKSIIAKSEANASKLFGCDTFYSTEGSSLCIRAMLYLCKMKQIEDRFPLEKARKTKASRPSSPKALSPEDPSFTPWVLATRNAHKTFTSACILLGLDAEWITPEGIEEEIFADTVTNALMEGIARHGSLPCCVYLTSPSYTGHVLPIDTIVKVCHHRGVPVVVDNAHGAYLRFLSGGLDPITQGADMCCDSAHKTLPALTGAAYLHVRRYFTIGDAKTKEAKAKRVKEAMSLFASTSPSWLILQSLDKLNPYLAGAFSRHLDDKCQDISDAKIKLRKAGFTLIGEEPLKIAFSARSWGYTGDEFAQILRTPKVLKVTKTKKKKVADEEEEDPPQPIEVEFSDPDVVVLMFSVYSWIDDILEVTKRILKVRRKTPLPPAPVLTDKLPEKVLTMREAAMSPCEYVPVDEALGRVAHLMDVACPPAIPIVLPGERIGKKQIEIMKFYGYSECKVVSE